jgi:hypothetical protein
MSQLGMPLYGCQTPDGYKQTQNAWLSPDAIMMRLSFATALGAGRLPLDRLVDEFAQKGRGRAQQRAVWPADLGTPRVDVSRPLDPALLMENVHDMLSRHTQETLEAATVQLRAPLILGSPEFMMR